MQQISTTTEENLSGNAEITSQQGVKKGIRAQSREIRVPANDPFKHDLLDRKEAVENLTHLVGNLDGPCVLSVDAAWGFGKTTFMKIWAQHLRNQGFPVIEFNAWKTDFSENPFLTLSNELTECFKSKDVKLADKTTEKLKSASRQVVRWVITSATGYLTSQIPHLGPQLADNAESLVKEMLSRHSRARTSVGSFNKALQDVAGELSEGNGGRPLVIMIDELDRCRPSYAVELLETAKHLFSVDHIIFVLAVNCDQLAHSIKAVYGSEFDAVGYLRRFFDVDFKLPEPDRHAFIESQLEETGIYDYFKQLPENRPHYHNIYNPEGVSRDAARRKFQGMLFLFFGASDLSLRTVGQAIRRLGLLYASLPDDQANHGWVTVAALILRALDPELYGQFVAGEVSDETVIDAIFSLPGLKSHRNGDGRFAFEVVIILSVLQKDLPDQSKAGRSVSSPLLNKYRIWASADKNLANKGGYQHEVEETEIEHARRVVKTVEDELSFGTEPVDFGIAIRRIELFSDSYFNDEADLSITTP